MGTDKAVLNRDSIELLRKKLWQEFGAEGIANLEESGREQCIEGEAATVFGAMHACLPEEDRKLMLGYLDDAVSFLSDALSERQNSLTRDALFRLCEKAWKRAEQTRDPFVQEEMDEQAHLDALKEEKMNRVAEEGSISGSIEDDEVDWGEVHASYEDFQSINERNAYAQSVTWQATQPVIRDDQFPDQEVNNMYQYLYRDLVDYLDMRLGEMWKECVKHQQSRGQGRA